MANTLLRQEIGGYVQTPKYNQCMYCGTHYSLRKRISEIRNPESKNALNCCSDRCSALEDALQETS